MTDNISPEEFGMMKSDVRNLKDTTGRIENKVDKMSDTLTNFTTKLPCENHDNRIRNNRNAGKRNRRLFWKLFGILGTVLIILTGWIYALKGNTP